MKKIALSLLVAVASLFGAGSAQAQISVKFTTDPMLPEYETLAKQVVEKQTTDPDGANKIFSKLLKKVAKSKEQATAVGKFFFDNNIYPCAKQCAAAAYKQDYAYEPGLLLGVAVHLMRKDYGQAGTKLDEILLANPNNVEAKRLSARVYKYVNPYAAKSILEELMQMDPNYEDIQKQMGDVAYMLDDLDLAAKSYGKYFAKTPNPDIMDLLSGENYLVALMSQADFYTMKDMIPLFEPLIDERDIVIPRMKFISQMETQDYSGAGQTVEYVASGRFNDTVYVDFDYAYGAAYFKLAENYEKAIELQKKRLALPNLKDKSALSANKDIADLYQSLKRPEEGVAYYEEYIKLMGDAADAAEKFGLGSYYIAIKDNCATKEEKDAIIAKADPIFEEYMQAAPEKPYGPFYRALLWTCDGSAPEAEPVKWYGKTVEVINSLSAEDQAKFSNLKLTALQYLLWDVAMNSQDKVAAKKLVNEVLAIDPNNGLAAQIKAVFGI